MTYSNIYAKYAARKTVRKTFPVSIQKMNMIDTATSRVLLKIEPVFHSKINEDSLSKSIAEAAGVRYLPNSIHRASEADRTLFGVFVAKNNETMSMNDAKEMASAGTMTQISDTVYQDENDNIWTVASSGESAYLVKQKDEDINSLLSAVHTRAIATASLNVNLFEDFGPGSPIVFYNRNAEELAFGVAVDGAKVYLPDSEKIVEVASEYVVSVWDSKSVKVELPETAVSGDKKVMLDYMTMLYGHNKEFLSEIRDIIMSGTSV